MKTIQIKTHCAICGKKGSYTARQGDIFVCNTLLYVDGKALCCKCYEKGGKA